MKLLKRRNTVEKCNVDKSTGVQIYGENKIHCRGLCVSGPTFITVIFSLFMIMIPVFIFHAFVSRWLIKNGIYYVTIVGLVFFFLTIYAFLKTSFMDPGIIPRQKSALNLYDVIIEEYRESQPPRHKEILINGNFYKLKYCYTCNIYRGLRTVHCSICDNCVEKFDHHCPWVGNCIGARNYKYFVFFVFNLCILICITLSASIYKLVMCIDNLSQKGYNAEKLFILIWKTSWESVILIIYTILTLWFVIGLLCYHIYTIITNQTTYEQIKTFYQNENPFNIGIFNNIKEILFTKTRPSYIDFTNPKLQVIGENAFQSILIVIDKGVNTDNKDYETTGKSEGNETNGKSEKGENGRNNVGEAEKIQENEKVQENGKTQEKTEKKKERKEKEKEEDKKEKEEKEAKTEIYKNSKTNKLQLSNLEILIHAENSDTKKNENKETRYITQKKNKRLEAKYRKKKFHTEAHKKCTTKKLTNKKSTSVIMKNRPAKMLNVDKESIKQLPSVNINKIKKSKNGYAGYVHTKKEILEKQYNLKKIKYEKHKKNKEKKKLEKGKENIDFEFSLNPKTQINTTPIHENDDYEELNDMSKKTIITLSNLGAMFIRNKSNLSSTTKNEELQEKKKKKGKKEKKGTKAKKINNGGSYGSNCSISSDNDQKIETFIYSISNDSEQQMEKRKKKKINHLIETGKTVSNRKNEKGCSYLKYGKKIKVEKNEKRVILEMRKLKKNRKQKKKQQNEIKNNCFNNFIYLKKKRKRIFHTKMKVSFFQKLKSKSEIYKIFRQYRESKRKKTEKAGKKHKEDKPKKRKHDDVVIDIYNTLGKRFNKKKEKSQILKSEIKKKNKPNIKKIEKLYSANKTNEELYHIIDIYEEQCSQINDINFKIVNQQLKKKKKLLLLSKYNRNVQKCYNGHNINLNDNIELSIHKDKFDNNKGIEKKNIYYKSIDNFINNKNNIKNTIYIYGNKGNGDINNAYEKNNTESNNIINTNKKNSGTKDNNNNDDTNNIVIDKWKMELHEECKNLNVKQPHLKETDIIYSSNNLNLYKCIFQKNKRNNIATDIIKKKKKRSNVFYTFTTLALVLKCIHLPSNNDSD